MSTKQPLSKNRFKALRIPWRKNLNKILGKSDVDNVDDRQSVIYDLKRDNQLLDEQNNIDKNKIQYFFGGPLGMDTYRKIVDDYHRSCNVGLNRSDDTMSRSLQRGELVNLQKTTMRKQLPNEDDANYLRYQLNINQKYTTNKALIENPKTVQPPSPPTTQIPLHLSNSEDNHDAPLLANEELETWGNTLENLKNQLQMQYEDDMNENSECYVSGFDEDENSYHSVSFQQEDKQQHENYNNNIQTFPTAITLNWNNCKLGPHDEDHFPDPGDSSQSFNRTLQNILCDGDSILKNDTIIGSDSPNRQDDIGKTYFTNNVLAEMKKHRKITQIRHSTDSSRQSSLIKNTPPRTIKPNNNNKVTSPQKAQLDEQQILREELHRVYGEINQLKSLCSTFATNMDKFSHFQDEIKQLFEKKFPDPQN